MKIGSLFSGYGGLDMGVQAVLGGETAWFVEYDDAPSRILAHHWPNVPNYGDITSVDWASVEPVDILTGGFPCQDVSLAGLRRGLKAGTRSGLWSEFARAIDTLRPSLVVIENVRGLLSAEATGSLEPNPWDVGDGESRPTLRALGAVLGDLAELGYDAEWRGVRASDAGAPHVRFRVVIVAYPASSGRERWSIPAHAASAHGQPRNPDGSDAQDSNLATRSQRGESAPGQAEGGRAWADLGGRGGAPDWGPYEEAIRRWERITGRLAPDPTEKMRLATPFVEWMMGLPAGHVTGVGLTRSQELKALGNGVVPQQAALALSVLLSHNPSKDSDAST